MKRLTLALVALVAGIASPVSAAPANHSVEGSITVDTFGNSITISARSDAIGGASGVAILESGLGQINGQSHVRIRIEITCLEVTGSLAFVGGNTVAASPSIGTVDPQYAFVLQDNGPGVADQSTTFGLSGSVNPCAEVFGPAVETALRGNIVVM